MLKWSIAICLVAFAAAEDKKREISSAPAPAASPAAPPAPPGYPTNPGWNEIPYGPNSVYPGPYGPVAGSPLNNRGEWGPYGPHDGWQGPGPWTAPQPWHGPGKPYDTWRPEWDNHQKWHAVWEYSAIPYSHTTVDVQNPEVGPARPHAGIQW